MVANILVCDPIHPEGLELLKSQASVDVHEGPPLSAAALARRIPDYQGVVVAGRTKIDRSVIDAADQLSVIGCVNGSLESVDVQAARRSGIETISSPDANSIAVAELTFALMLGLARKLTVASERVMDGVWDKGALLGLNLAGKTLGVVGLGRIGRQVVKRARAFDMRVVVHQNRLTEELAQSLGLEHAELDGLMQRSDFVSVHVPLRPGNVGLINERNLRQMKRSAFLINTSLGGVVDEEALLRVLDEGVIAGAGVDGFVGRSDVTWRLIRHPKVLATPFIGANTLDAQREASVSVCSLLLSLVQRPKAASTLALEVAPIEKVIPHERHNPQRVAQLAERIAEDGILANPPVTARVGDTYVILDGATRVTAFRRLGFPHIVVQVVDPDADDIELQRWYHAVHGGSVDELLRALSEVPNLSLVEQPVEALSEATLHGNVAGHLSTVDGRGFLVQSSGAPGQPGDWLTVLTDLVERYGQWGHVERTTNQDIAVLLSQFPDLAGLFTFPAFTLEMILTLAAQGRTVPAGITRFVIPGRILRLNAPLARLASDEPLESKRRWLDNLVRERLAERQVRYYQEPVILLDE